MRPLSNVRPTPEQLAVISRNRAGIEVIRGAAGSGKTTTALLRLRSLSGTFLSKRRRENSLEPVRVLALTFNRTLRGYIAALAREHAQAAQLDLEISTFSKWAFRRLERPEIIDENERRSQIVTLGRNLHLPPDFLVQETEYAMGRFHPNSIDEYLTCRRDGRGITPRVDRGTRQQIINDVIRPYEHWKQGTARLDWNDLAISLFNAPREPLYDIIVCDETQDFSANQIRAVLRHLAPVHSLTLILDTTQRIYPRGFTWQEVGITVRPENSTRLERNYRNTIEIAQFAAPLVAGIPIDDDGSMPDFTKCTRHGRTPIVFRGRFRSQVNFAVDFIGQRVNLANESVAFLHPLGGGWLDYLRSELSRRGLPFIDVSREPDWPEGQENIALSTLSSAKGLEFDHVIIIGLNDQVTPHGANDDDDILDNLRRLLAMGIGRARESVMIGYKPENASTLVRYLDPTTFEQVDL